MATRYERGTSNFDRPLGFFDAVYGFALTLLVTTIDVSDRQAWQSLDRLLADHGTELLSFLISFVVIVAFWRASHDMIGRFTALDPATILANVVVLGFVVLVPFATEAMGDPALQDLPLPTAIYAFIVGTALVASIVMYQIALSRGLVEEPEPPRVRRVRLLDAALMPAVMFASIPVTYLGVALWGDSSAGKLFWMLLIVLGPLSGRLTERYVRRSVVERDPTSDPAPADE